ncbi:MAG: hypothetical protein LBF60_07850 [Treponema sp.]|jgi:hypothetical protein|nr:hypothetical protein [Treponema sp.]
MQNISHHINNAIPEEYQEIAAALFLENSSLGTIDRFADVLGIGNDYKRFLAITDATEIHKRLEHFQNNLNILIQKTWVEKADEVRKEKLQDRAPEFIEHIEKGDYQRALKDFNGILDELAYLFFGIQSHKEDFTEYTFRIDTQMGLFWWYGSQLASFKQTDSEHLKALLALGICYLTNF